MYKYKILKTLGEGNFGVVYKATNVQTGETVAIKKFKKKYKSWDDCIALPEVKSLRKLSHPNIIKLKEVLHIADELYLVFEFLEYNVYELYSRNKYNKKKMTENEIRSIVYQVADGLAYIHKNGFFHRDLKPYNLLAYNNVVKLCDFGLAREVRSSPPFTEYVSTRWYRAPYLLLGSRNYNSPVDIFALGCIMFYLYLQSPLFPGKSYIDQMNLIVKILGTPEQNQWPEGYKLASAKSYYFPQAARQSIGDMIPDASPYALDLLYSMLQYPSRKRPTALEILKHPYFENCKSMISSMPAQKEVVLESMPEGKPLDTKKEDKKQYILKLTKYKFRLTREEIFQKYKELDAYQDLDAILKDLEEKVSQKNKLPMLSTREKFRRPDPMEMRESKTYMSNPQPKPPLHELKKVDRSKMISIDERPRYELKRNERFNSEKKDELPSSKHQMKSELVSNKLNYNFQPVQLLPPALMMPMNKGLGSWPRGLAPPPPRSLIPYPLPSRHRNLYKLLKPKIDF